MNKEYKIEIEGRKNPIILSADGDKEWQRRSFVHQKVIDFAGVHLECVKFFENNKGFYLEQIPMFKGQRITKVKVSEILKDINCEGDEE